MTFFLLCALLKILSGVTPRSERTLAIPLASTPQLGATFLSQRRCTFTLHTEASITEQIQLICCQVQRLIRWTGDIRTFTLESLSEQTPQQRSTVIAEGQDLKVVNAKLVWNVDAEPLRSD